MLLERARTLSAGELEAVFLPNRGMLGASFRHRGAEILGRVDDLARAAAAGSTAGIPLLHPWANRLAGLTYEAAGHRVDLDPASPFLHLDANRLPIHGTPWSQLVWTVADESETCLVATLPWSSPKQLAIFPYPHALSMSVQLDEGGLEIATTLTAAGDSSVPVSFGFHPYVVVPGLARRDWQLELPPMERLALDEHGIPTGARAPFAGFTGELGDRELDDGFACGAEVSLALAGNGRRIEVMFRDGFRYAQVFAPRSLDVVALEPMTAPTNALRSGDGLRPVDPGGSFTASFRISVA